MLANTLYLIALTLLSPWILYRRLRHGRYQRGWREKLFGLSATQAQRLVGGGAAGRREEGTCLWVHAVSVGEVNLLRGVVDRIHQNHPDLPVVISTSTDTGYDLAIQRFGQDHVFFCPLDFTWAVKRTLRNLNPKLLVLAELELWPNLIRCTRRHGRDVMVINGRLSKRSAAGYQRFRALTQPIFESLSRVECQDSDSAQRFEQCGTPRDRIAVSGSLKFDDAPESKSAPDVVSRHRWAGVAADQTVWVVGSTQEGEEQMALDIYQRLLESHPQLRLILVPRHPERFDRVAGLIQAAGFQSHRRSCDESHESLGWESDRVILVDTIGELRAWWGVGQIATVGGSFGDRGGQNMLEPAGYGLAVSFGPNTRNFRDIADRLLNAKGAVRAQDAAELETFVTRCLNETEWATAIGRAAQQVIRSHRGSTQRVIAGIDSLLPQAPIRHVA